MSGAKAVIDTLITTLDKKNAEGEKERQKNSWLWRVMRVCA